MPEKSPLYDRRSFLSAGMGISLFSASVGSILLDSCKNTEEEKEVSPPEDLMQEHGLLNRILLIYEHCRIQLVNKQDLDITLLNNSAAIIRQFVEDYHEKQEEDHIFPRFEKAGILVPLVTILRDQHKGGRNITDHIMQITRSNNTRTADTEQLIILLSQFNRMYRPHESREDTVLFPSFRKLVSQHEYDSLGEEFEKNEHKLFGENGFESFVSKVEGIEKALGIYELSQFTPTIS